MPAFATVSWSVILEHGQSLLVFTATPGTESYDKLRLLSVIGTQRLTSDL